jgi:sporulation protein YlmC with PRC-barrel domain
MYARISELQDLPIVSLQTGEAVAWLRRPILEPATLEIVAFRSEIADRRRRSQVLLTADIRQYATDCILVDSDEELTDQADVVRLQALIHTNYNPTGKHVVTDAGRKLGTVEDYSVNLESNRVKKLFVRQSLLHAWIGTSLTVDRTQILDITGDRIVVRDSTLKSPIIPTDPVPGTPP